MLQLGSRMLGVPLRTGPDLVVSGSDSFTRPRCPLAARRRHCSHRGPPRPTWSRVSQGGQAPPPGACVLTPTRRRPRPTPLGPAPGSGPRPPVRES